MTVLLLLNDGSCVELEGTRALILPNNLKRSDYTSYVKKKEHEAIPLHIRTDPDDAIDEGDIVLGSHFGSFEVPHQEHLHAEM